MSDYLDTMVEARKLGREYADSRIAGGERTPQESPLSGEWAGAIVPGDVFLALGLKQWGDLEDFEITDTLDNWEDGYTSAPWPDPIDESDTP